jgi:hypothetical protein
MRGDERSSNAAAAGRAPVRRPRSRRVTAVLARALIGVAVLAWWVPSPSAADVETFDVPPGCGELDAFRERVIALGADLQALAAARVLVRIERDGGSYELDVQVHSGGGSVERALEEEECVDLVGASAVIVVLALRDLVQGGAESASSTATSEAAGADLVLTIVSEPVTVERDAGAGAREDASRSGDASERDGFQRPRVHLELDVGVEFGIGVLDRPTSGVRAGARLAIEWLEVELGAILWPSRFIESPSGAPEGARFWILSGLVAVGPVWHVGRLTLAPAAELDLGAISASSTGLDRTEEPVDLHAAAALRFGVRFAFLRAFGIYCSLTGGMMLYRSTFEIDGIGPLFETPLLFARAGAGIFVGP